MHCDGGSFTVKTVIEVTARRGYQTIVHDQSGGMVIARGCDRGEDDSIIVDRDLGIARGVAAGMDAGFATLCAPR